MLVTLLKGCGQLGASFYRSSYGLVLDREPIGDTIVVGAINDLSEAGYEFNVNFGPVIAKEGWQRDYGPRPARIAASRGLAP